VDWWAWNRVVERQFADSRAPRDGNGAFPLPLIHGDHLERRPWAIEFALHAGTRAAGSDTATQTGPVAGTCSLGFSVPDLKSTYAELLKRGACFVVPPTEQVNEGIRLAVCVDPDGLSISFAAPLPHEAAGPA